MRECIFENICDRSWCRLYSFECIDKEKMISYNKEIKRLIKLEEL